MSKWIPVKERLPKKHVNVLVYSDGIDDVPYDIGMLNEELTWDCFGWNYPISHWMPLPDPPTPNE